MNLKSFALALMLASAVAPVSAQQLVGQGQSAGSKVVVTSLKRDAGGTVTLRFQLINEGEQDVKTYGVLGTFFTLDHVSLVDGDNKKKYLVVKDSAGECLCSELKQDSKPGSSFNLWAKFPAPPDTVQNITVVIPSFEPIESVPITAP